MDPRTANSFFDVMVKNNDKGYHHLTHLMDKYLFKDILNDTLFELFLAIRKYAVPDSIVEIKAVDHDEKYILWTKFQIPTRDLLKFDVEVQKANDLINLPKQEIIKSRMEEYRKEPKPVLDGFKMVMAYAHSKITYKTLKKDNLTEIQITMELPKNQTNTSS